MRRVSIISPKVFIRGSVILLSTLFLLLPNFATAQDFTAMTRKLYIGAESQSLAAAPDNDEADQTPSGLWPSDHAGVVARMKFAP